MPGGYIRTLPSSPTPCLLHQLYLSHNNQFLAPITLYFVKNSSFSLFTMPTSGLAGPFAMSSIPGAHLERVGDIQLSVSFQLPIQAYNTIYTSC